MLESIANFSELEKTILEGLDLTPRLTVEAVKAHVYIIVMISNGRILR